MADKQRMCERSLRVGVTVTIDVRHSLRIFVYDHLIAQIQPIYSS